MRFASFILILFFVIACKPDSPAIEDESVETSILGIEDYREIVRHPISLAENIDTNTWSKIKFLETEFDFDTVVAGDVINKTFEFVNSGSKPLYILDTRVSCGCTAAAHSKEAIEPGKKGNIEVEFDTFGKSGEQYKTITILSNSHPNEDKLTMRGYVKTIK